MQVQKELDMQSIYDFKVQKAAGSELDLADYKGKVLLIVNVASKCGFTPQYDGLEKLYQEYKDQGLEILGFPCNQFEGQEPGSNKEIQEFCRMNYGVTFPVLAKVEVNGDNAAPLYKWMKDQEPGELVDVPKDHKFYDFFIEHHGGKHWGKDIPWNFTKFLFNREGKLVGRYASPTTPEELAARIEKLL